MSGFSIPEDTDVRLTGVLVVGAVVLLVIVGRVFRDVSAG